MVTRILAAIGAVHLLVASAVAGQLPARRYGVSDGLIDSTVSAIYHDARGYLWFGTSGGISRFDGYRFVSYTVRDGLGHPFVSTIVEDHRGRLWIGTNGGGVARFLDDPAERRAAGGRRFVNFPVGTTAASNRVNAMLFDASGALWCVTDAGIYRALPGSGGPPRFEVVVPGEPTTTSMSATADRRGTLWFGIPGAIVEVTAGKTTFHRPPDLQSRTVASLAEGPDGRLFAASGESVFELPPPGGAGGREPWRRMPVALEHDQSVNSIVVDANGGLWLGTTRGLIAWRDSTQALFTSADGLSQNDVSALSFDRGGNLWLATFGGGACEVSSERVLNFAQAAGLPDQKVHQAVEDEAGRVFAVTNASGLVEIVDGRAVPVRTPGLSAADWAWSRVLQDRRRRWWVGNRRGLFRIRGPRLAYGDAGLLLPADGTPRIAIATLHDDGRRVLASFQDGSLFSADTSDERPVFRPFDLGDGWPPGKVVSRMLSDRSGALWIGDQGALARRVGGRTTSLAPGEGLPEANPRALFEDSRGWIWIGLRYGGLSVTRDPGAASPRFVNFSRLDGLSSDAVWCLAEGPDGAIYAGTGNGFDRVDPATGAIRRFSPAGGLGGATILECTADRRGNIWLSTTAGLSRFDPRAVRTATRRPPIYLTRVRVGERDVELPDTGLASAPGALAVPGSDGGVTFEYVGLYFGLGPQLRYRYKLDGIDATWSQPTEQRSVSYAHLAPGEYTFRVAAVGQEDGQSSETPAAFTFRVPTPWWQRWWVRLCALSLVAGLVHGLYRQRLRRSLAAERLRTRVATDLHDHIASDLSMIAMTSEMARAGVPRDNVQLAESLSTIARTSRDLVDSMSDIVWAVNPRRDHLSDLVNRMRRFANDAVAASTITLSFRAPDAAPDLHLGPDVRREVFLIFKEAMNNLLRHSQCTSCEVHLSIERGWLTLIVGDNGRGFPGEAPDGNGLPSMRRRAAAVGGRFAVASQPGGGTTIRVEVPAGATRWRWPPVGNKAM